VSFVRASPLSRGIGSGDELRRHLAGGTPSSLIESVEVLPHGAPIGGEVLPVRAFCTGDGPLLISVRGDQAGVHRKSFAAYQPFLNTAAHHGLEDMPERFAIPEATMAVLRKGRVIRHFAVQPELTEPAIGQIKMQLFT
jgi:hypothetical protein